MDIKSPSTSRKSRKRLSANISFVDGTIDEVSQEVKPTNCFAFDRYLYFNHFTEERYILVHTEETIKIKGITDNSIIEKNVASLISKFQRLSAESQTHSGKEKIIDVNFYFQLEGDDEKLFPTRFEELKGRRFFYFQSKKAETRQFVFSFGLDPRFASAADLVKFPPNQSGIFLQDLKNNNILYYADKKICEYFSWNKMTGEIIQVS